MPHIGQGCKHQGIDPQASLARGAPVTRNRYRSPAKGGRIVHSRIRRMPVPKTTQNAAKKRPVPTKRSPVIKSGNTSASPVSGADDDVNVMSLRLPPGKLSPEMAAYFEKCEEKLGFVPNVLKAFAFDDGKLQAFVDYRHELVQNAANLSKLEIEMIATVVSAQNRCFYCITAHGNGVRQLGTPVLGEMMVQNYRAAGGGGRGPRKTAPRRLHQPQHLRHRLGRRFLQHDQPPRLRDGHAPEQR